VKPENYIVYMIGFMGSGKTTAGKKLASFLGWEFSDLDKLIEEKAGMTIPEIFKIQGEESFRKLESDLLRSIESDENLVISTGGGAPCFNENMDYMNKTGLTIYLRLNPGQLKSRLLNGMAERPLLKDLDENGLLDFITSKLDEREVWYAKSKLIVDGFSPDIQSIAALVRNI